MKSIKVFIFLILCLFINSRQIHAAEVTNIALFGIDEQIESVMIFSYNRSARKTFLTAIPQQTLLTLQESNQQQKLHTLQEIPLIIQTLNFNFNLIIDRYVSVDVHALKAMVDAIGGIEVELLPEEINEFSKLTHLPIETSGPKLLNGSHAIAYSKIQGHKSNPYERLERQQYLTALIGKKVKSYPKVKLISLITDTLPYFETNLMPNEVITLATQIAFGNNAKLKRIFLPHPELTELKEETLIPMTLEQNILRWKQQIYSS